MTADDLGAPQFSPTLANSSPLQYIEAPLRYYPWTIVRHHLPGSCLNSSTAAVLSLMERASVSEDAALRAQARDAVDRLFREHERRVFRVCRRFLGDSQAAQDMTQEVMLTAYRRLGDYRGDGSFYSFLYGIARFKCMNATRKRRDLLTDDGVLEGVDDQCNALEMVRREQRRALIRDIASTALDKTEQEAVHLRYEVGLGQDEIGRLLRVTGKSGGRGLLVRCRRKLRAELLRRKSSMGLTSTYLQVSR